jgi:MFS family permease
LWIASVVSNIGGWMQAVGSAWLMTSLSSSPLMVTMVQFAGSLPIVLLSLPAGALADTGNRRVILLVSQLWMLIAAALMACLAIGRELTPGGLLSLTAVLSLGTALMGPAFQAVITEVVPESQMSSAVSLNSAGFNLARAAGPALGGLVLAKAGSGATFMLNAFSFLAVIVVLLKWRPRSRRKSVLPAERFVGAIRGGLRYVQYAPALRIVLCRTACFVFMGSALWALLPLVVRNEFRFGPSAYGVALGALGTGAVIGALAMPVLKEKLSPELIVSGSMAVFGVVTGLSAILRSYPFLLLALVAGGVAWLMLLSVLNVAVRTVVPGWIEARALATNLIAFQGATALGSLWWGFVSLLGLRQALLSAGIGMLLSLLLAIRYPLNTIAAVNTAPAPPWPAPPPVDPSQQETSPALITIRYEVEPSRSLEFRKVMHRLELSRRRYGAICWGLFADPARPGAYMEQFLVESWLEHRRQHERTVADDRALQEIIGDMQTSPDFPVVTHFIADEQR